MRSGRIFSYRTISRLTWGETAVMTSTTRDSHRSATIRRFVSGKFVRACSVWTRTFTPASRAGMLAYNKGAKLCVCTTSIRSLRNNRYKASGSLVSTPGFLPNTKTGNPIARISSPNTPSASRAHAENSYSLRSKYAAKLRIIRSSPPN